MITLEKCYIWTPLQKLPKNVANLGKLIVAKALKSCPKYNKSPNLVTLIACEELGGGRRQGRPLLLLLLSTDPRFEHYPSPRSGLRSGVLTEALLLIINQGLGGAIQ